MSTVYSVQWGVLYSEVPSKEIRAENHSLSNAFNGTAGNKWIAKGWGYLINAALINNFWRGWSCVDYEWTLVNGCGS